MFCFSLELELKLEPPSLPIHIYYQNAIAPSVDPGARYFYVFSLNHITLQYENIFVCLSLQKKLIFSLVDGTGST